MSLRLELNYFIIIDKTQIQMKKDILKTMRTSLDLTVIQDT